MLNGYRTYIVAATMAGLGAAHAFGFLDYRTYEAIMGILAGAGVTTMRAAVSNETAALPKPANLPQ